MGEGEGYKKIGRSGQHDETWVKVFGVVKFRTLFADANTELHNNRDISCKIAKSIFPNSGSQSQVEVKIFLDWALPAGVHLGMHGMVYCTL